MPEIFVRLPFPVTDLNVVVRWNISPVLTVEIKFYSWLQSLWVNDVLLFHCKMLFVKCAKCSLHIVQFKYCILEGWTFVTDWHAFLAQSRTLQSQQRLCMLFHYMAICLKLEQLSSLMNEAIIVNLLVHG